MWQNSNAQDKDSAPDSNKKQQIQKYLYFLAMLLLIPALGINLGLLTFIDDEAMRALIALEMKLSGNYITPTINGAYYYNKPPLYNWILLFYFELAGIFNEWVARTPTLVAIVGFSTTIFYFFTNERNTSRS